MEEGKSICLRDMNCKQMKEFGGGGGMIALVFMDLQEEKCILRATSPQREYNHTITKKKKKIHFHRMGPARENRQYRGI